MWADPIDGTLPDLMAATALVENTLSILWITASVAVGKTGG
jgi:hypothetical protein